MQCFSVQNLAGGSAYAGQPFPALPFPWQASSSASGSKLAELEEDTKGLKEQKASGSKKEKGTRDLESLAKLHKDLNQVWAAITALS